jgi:hypothetical protein
MAAKGRISGADAAAQACLFMIGPEKRRLDRSDGDWMTSKGRSGLANGDQVTRG